MLVHNCDLTRRGAHPERAGGGRGLNAQAQRAEAQGLPHGVTASTTPSGGTNRTATRTDVESAGFPVHDTPTRNDPGHVTVELPKPVTTEDAASFNEVFRVRE